MQVTDGDRPMAGELLYRKRAATAVEARIAAMHTTPTGIARAAGVDPKTVRALLAGASWPQSSTRARIEEALGWPVGELTRRAITDRSMIRTVPTLDLLAEVVRRVEEGEC